MRRNIRVLCLLHWIA